MLVFAIKILLKRRYPFRALRPVHRWIRRQNGIYNPTIEIILTSAL